MSLTHLDLIELIQKIKIHLCHLYMCIYKTIEWNTHKHTHTNTHIYIQPKTQVLYIYIYIYIYIYTYDETVSRITSK